MNKEQQFRQLIRKKIRKTINEIAIGGESWEDDLKRNTRDFGPLSPSTKKQKSEVGQKLTDFLNSQLKGGSIVIKKTDIDKFVNNFIKKSKLLENINKLNEDDDVEAEKKFEPIQNEINNLKYKWSNYWESEDYTGTRQIEKYINNLTKEIQNNIEKL